MDPFCIKSVINSKTDPLPREATLKLITEPVSFLTNFVDCFCRLYVILIQKKVLLLHVIDPMSKKFAKRIQMDFNNLRFENASQK